MLTLRGIKNIGGQKRSITKGKLKPKKSSLGRYKKERDQIGTPKEDLPESTLRGIKNFGGQKRPITSSKMKVKKKTSKEI